MKITYEILKNIKETLDRKTQTKYENMLNYATCLDNYYVKCNAVYDEKQPEYISIEDFEKNYFFDSNYMQELLPKKVYKDYIDILASVKENIIDKVNNI